jgi:cyclophilin family peptidyl-prolyl cis-trans isomerase
MIQPRFVMGLVLAGLLAGAVLAGQQPKPKAAGPAKAAVPAGPVIVFETVKGPFEVETYPGDSPKSVEHVLGLVRDGFYRGLRVHWVQGVAVQFGDPLTKDMTKQSQWGNGGSGKNVGVVETSKRKFERGMVGLYYRTDYGPKFADSQIFVLRGANPALDGKYAVIGHVVNGMNVVDKIEVPDRIMTAYVKGEQPRK